MSRPSDNHPSSLTRCLDRYRWTLLLFFISCFTACSSRPAPEPLSIDELISPHGAQVTEISTSPRLYELSIQNQGKGYQLFGTGLKECDVKEFIPSRATTRELFVGFEQLQVLSQGYATQNGKRIYRSELTARIDGQPIEVVAYTYRDADCVSDYAFWRAQLSNRQDPGLRALLETSVLQDIAEHD